jgi:hypothetical protein
MMAKEYTVKVFGKKTKYRKIGSKYYRIKKDGELAKDAATGLVLANLKNAAGSRLVSSPDKMLATVRSAVSGTNKKGQMGRGMKKAMASTTKDDGGKAKLDLVRDIDKSRLMPKDGGRAALRKSQAKDAFNIMKKDTNIKTDAKPPKKIVKKKDIKELKKSNLKGVKVTKTKALQNKPKQDVKKKVEKKITKKPESKLDSKGNYKGTNIKPTKLQLERLKKRELA